MWSSTRRRGSGRVGVALDHDTILRIASQDVAKLRELLHRGRLEDRAVAAEQERRFEVHQDSRFGPSRVCDLLELLGLLVEVIADGAAGDPAHDGAEGRSFPAAG